MNNTQKRSDKDHRPQIVNSKIHNAHYHVLKRLFERLEEKGHGAWLSRHEILGFVTEEYDELVGAVHEKSLEEVKEELKDIGVACTFAIACIDSKTLDW